MGTNKLGIQPYTPQNTGFTAGEARQVKHLSAPASLLTSSSSGLSCACCSGMVCTANSLNLTKVEANNTSVGKTLDLSTLQSRLNLAHASFPVENFITYSSPFGYRKSGSGAHQFHLGLDIAAPEWSRIRNAFGGVIKAIISESEDPIAGATIVLEINGVEHSYSHMQQGTGLLQLEPANPKEGTPARILIAESPKKEYLMVGASLPAGAPVGLVGMTGRTEGPHLHWGVKVDGKWVNPAPALTEMYNIQAKK